MFAKPCEHTHTHTHTQSHTPLREFAAASLDRWLAARPRKMSPLWTLYVLFLSGFFPIFVIFLTIMPCCAHSEELVNFNFIVFWSSLIR